MVFQSADSSRVFSNVVGNCSSGASIGIKPGTYTVNTQWVMKGKNSVTLNFEAGAKLCAANGLNSNVFAICQSTNIVVNGVTIDGNAANQSPNDNFPSNVPNGIFVGGFADAGCSNVKINNAVIYNVRQFGVYIGFTANSNCGVANSKIYNCGWNGWTACSDSQNCYLTNSEIYGCSDVGASTYGTGSIITGNYIHDMNGSTGSVLPGSRWAVGIEGGSGDTISGNTIQTSAMGVFNAGFANVAISQNTFKYMVEAGVYVYAGSTNTSITNNDFTLCTSGTKAAKIINSGSGTTINANTAYP